jgi:hypothetical protein
MTLVATYVGIGDPPRVGVDARALSPRTVRVNFSETMKVNAAIQNIASYTITEDVGSTAVAVTDVSLGSAFSPTYVILTLDADLSVGFDNYNVLVTSGVKDVAGNSLDEDHDNDDFSGLDFGVLDHCEDAKARLLEQFKRTNLADLICALCEPAGDLERAIADIRSYRSLDTAFGIGLDRLGQLYRRPRNGRDDEDYRVILKVEAFKVSSKGTPNDIITLITMLDDGVDPESIIYEEHYPAGILVSSTVPLGSRLRGVERGEILKSAKPAGVRLVYLFTEDGAELFGWDDDLDALPWGEESDDEIGGIWAEGI